MRFRNREDRERYMDSLERQMEHQREQLQRALDRIESSGRRRTALERLRKSLPSFPGRTSVEDAGEREGPQPAPEETGRGTEPPNQHGAEPRSWWRRMFGG